MDKDKIVKELYAILDVIDYKEIKSKKVKLHFIKCLTENLLRYIESDSESETV